VRTCPERPRESFGTEFITIVFSRYARGGGGPFSSISPKYCTYRLCIGQSDHLFIYQRFLAIPGKKKERDLGRIRDAPVGEGALRGVVRQSLFGRFEEAAVYEESGDHLRMIRAEIFASIFLSTSTNSSLLTLAN
jgi:hypothetical protein